MQNRNTFFNRTKCGAYKGAKVGLLGSLGLTIPFSFLVMTGDSPQFCSKSSLILLTLIAGGAAGLAAGTTAGAALGATNSVASRTIRKKF